MATFGALDSIPIAEGAPHEPVAVEKIAIATACFLIPCFECVAFLGRVRGRAARNRVVLQAVSFGWFVIHTNHCRNSPDASADARTVRIGSANHGTDARASIFFGKALGVDLRSSSW